MRQPTGTGSLVAHCSPPARRHWRIELARSLAVLAAGVLTGVMPARVRADVVAASDRPAVVNVEVLALRDGELQYRFSTGRTASRPIHEIDYLQISGWPLFNLAEKQQRDKHFRQAINSYEKALNQLGPTDSKTQTPAANQPGGRREAPGRKAVDDGAAGLSQADRTLLLKCRLLTAYDADGQFDQAVAMYLEILESTQGGPAYLDRVRPNKLPAAGSKFLATAAKLVEAALDRHGPDTIGMSLARWRNRWPDVQPSEDQLAQASRPAASLPAGSLTPPEITQGLSAVQSLIDAGQFDEALRRIDDLQKAPVGPARADLYYWQARALLGKHKEEDSAEARRDRQRAGLALMRVVIHFPGHQLAPECLHRAAEICVRHGQPGQASTLWSELIENYPAAVPWSDWARQEINRRRGPASAPVR